MHRVPQGLSPQQVRKEEQVIFQQTTGIIVCADCGHEFHIHGLVVGANEVVPGLFEVDVVPSEEDKTLMNLHKMSCTGKGEK
ncbi:MAG: hypothetical protein RLZ55_371 [Actinomycetota bacterium]